MKGDNAFTPVVHWFQVHDRGYIALRRAGRTAIVLPALFAIGLKVIDNPTIALFAGFGTIAQVTFVGFVGEMRSRLEAQASLAVAGAVLVTLATLCSQEVWLAALSMAVVAFAVIFLGVVSSVIASSTTALLLAFILPVATPAPLSELPDRLYGWGLASGAAFLAVWLLWPTPGRSPLRVNLASAFRTLADRLSSIAKHVAPADETAQASDPVGSLRRLFLATPWRPTGLGASDRAIIRLVDEVAWLNSVIDDLVSVQAAHPSREFSHEVQSSAAKVLSEASQALDSHSVSIEELRSAQSELSRAITDLEGHLEHHFLAGDSSNLASSSPTKDELAARFVTSIEFSFRSREVGFAAMMIATNVERAILAEQRSYMERLLGHEPGGTSLWSSARSRIISRLRHHSIWLHNSVRGAIGLAIAVAVAEELSVEHSFWVILGTLSVLRSNAASTGQNAARAIGGTIIGFVIGAALVVLIGTNSVVLWLLLPLSLLVAAFAPTAISFVVGQAGFTFFLVILFNILAPVGWHVGLIRIEDVAIGVAVSAGVSLLIWPRGAAAELGAAMRAAYVNAAAYLAAASRAGTSRAVDAAEAENSAAEEAAGAARRLDDAFRNYLAESGAKPAPLSDVTTLVTGITILRLSADAVIDLWEHIDVDGTSWRAARDRLDALAGLVVSWYDDFADRFESSATFVSRSAQTVADHEVGEAVHDELVRSEQPNLAPAVRILWTAGHLNAAQRLESAIANAAKASERLWAERRLFERYAGASKGA
jgi:uncharacterized membrane protein YccC